MTNETTTPALQGAVTATNGKYIKDILVEIAAMREFCIRPENYANGYDTMAECWDDRDYEDLFYTDADTLEPYAQQHNQHNQHQQHNQQTPTPTRSRNTADQAWDILHSIASVYADQAADAKNSAW